MWDLLYLSLIYSFQFQANIFEHLIYADNMQSTIL